MPQSNEARAPQLLTLVCLEPVLGNKRSHRNEKLTCLNEEQPPLMATRESPHAARKTQHSQKSIQFSRSVLSDSLRPPWTAARQASLSITNSQSPPNPCPLSQWCHPTISSSEVPFSSCSQYFPASGSFQMRQLFKSCGQSIGVSASTSVPPMNHPGLITFRMDWLDLFAVEGTLKSLLQHYSSKASTLRRSAFIIVRLSHPYMTTGKTIALTRRTFVDKVMSLLFNMLSRLVITFLSRSKHLLISWLQSPSAVILEPRKINKIIINK